MLRPLDCSTSDPIFLIWDASVLGTGAMIGQGKSWDTCHPAVFHSRKFTPAQTNYPTHEQELLAVTDALRTYGHLLVGTACLQSSRIINLSNL